MSIQGKVLELSSIKNELLSMRKRGTILRKRIKEIEGDIDDYLEAKGQPGLKYKDVAITRENITKRPAKKKTDIESDSLAILESHGIENPEKLLGELFDARRGSPHETRKLKFKPFKKNGRKTKV